MAALVAAVYDDDRRSPPQRLGQAVLLEQDPVLERLVPELDLAPGLRVVLCGVDVVDAFVLEPSGEVGRGAGRAGATRRDALPMGRGYARSTQIAQRMAKTGSQASTVDLLSHTAQETGHGRDRFYRYDPIGRVLLVTLLPDAGAPGRELPVSLVRIRGGQAHQGEANRERLRSERPRRRRGRVRDAPRRGRPTPCWPAP
jgi:hypothetical protein